MKKAITVLFSVSCILAASVSNLNAQENAFAVSVYSGNATSSGISKSVNAPNGVSTKVYNDFTKRFDNVSDVYWSTKDNYTFVYFKKNGIPVRGTYNKNGKLEYTVRYYNDNQVPVKFTNLMRRNGYNMNIIHVMEVEGRYTTTLFVKMEDAKSFKTIQVRPDGELSEYESYQKAQ